MALGGRVRAGSSAPVCSYCKFQILPADLPVLCHLCCLPQHHSCSTITSSAAKCLRSEDNIGLSYFCEPCRPVVYSLLERNKLITEITHRYDLLETAIFNLTNEVRVGFQRMKATLASRSQTADDIHNSSIASSIPGNKKIQGQSHSVVVEQRSSKQATKSSLSKAKTSTARPCSTDLKAITDETQFSKQEVSNNAQIDMLSLALGNPMPPSSGSKAHATATTKDSGATSKTAYKSNRRTTDLHMCSSSCPPESESDSSDSFSVFLKKSDYKRKKKIKFQMKKTLLSGGKIKLCLHRHMLIVSNQCPVRNHKIN